MICGGMESMSNAPFIYAHRPKPASISADALSDSLLIDGLTDESTHRHMGLIAEDYAKDYGFSREEQDAFAARSFKKVISATRNGLFKDEIIPVPVQKDGQHIEVTEDEQIKKVSFLFLPSPLRHVFFLLLSSAKKRCHDSAQYFLPLEPLRLQIAVELMMQQQPSSSSVANMHRPITFAYSPAFSPSVMLPLTRLSTESRLQMPSRSVFGLFI